jgi:hypothetical protein
LKKYIPFHEIKEQEVIVVDGLHPYNLVLSHWKGANIHENIFADTSGEIVLNAIKLNFPGINCPNISATHFDIDGFVGVFALFYPELAMKHFDVFKEMAIIGDFRHYSPERPGADLALKLCCWMNKVEKEKFYAPFGEKDEIRLCVEKFEYFLPRFSDVLETIEKYKSDWEEEYSQVIKETELKKIKNKYHEIGLIFLKAENPIHYYALFSETDDFDIVLSSYSHNRFELEFKYTTWVDLVSRPVLPRISLKELVNQLNQIEQSDFIWKADGITDTGPILRLEKEGLSKAERYANPTERDIYSSSISEETFVKIVIAYLTQKYQNIAPKNLWTWEEMKAL